jgi:photosystem II stability/assembly factor-like uncharacterized protein
MQRFLLPACRKVWLFTMLFCISNMANSQWTSLSTGTTSMYESMYFFDANNGIASSTTDVIKTSNGGTSWSVVSTSGIRDIDFASTTVGYAAGITGSSLYKTANGGSSWTALTPLDNTNLWGVSVVDANTIFVCGNNHVVWKSTNGGSSFTAVNIAASQGNLVDIQFFNSTTGCVLENGATSQVWRTTNGGTTWTSTEALAYISMTSMFFVNANVGFAVGSNGVIIKTTNGGVSWTYQTVGTSVSLQYVDFYDYLNGIAVGTGGVVYHTKDGGTTWTLENSGILGSASLYSCNMLSPTKAIVAGAAGVMYKTTALIGDVEQFSLSSDFSVFPNPVSNTITVEISDLNQSEVDVTVFNMQGQLLIEQTISQARTEIDVSSIARGVYYIRVEDKDRTGVRKFIRE